MIHRHIKPENILLHAGPPLVADFGIQRFAFDVRHHVVEHALRLARVVEQQDVGMVQPGGDLDLSQEPLGPEDGRAGAVMVAAIHYYGYYVSKDASGKDTSARTR